MNKKIKKDTSKSRTPNLYCDKCGFKKRGKNHEVGDHHQKGTDGKSKIN